MQHADPTNKPADLFGLLEKERRLIMAGDIQKIARLLPTKEKLLAELGVSNVPADKLERLKCEADRNQTLLEAVAAGIRAVQKRLAALQSANFEHRTYTQSGRAQKLTSQRTSIEKKA